VRSDAALGLKAADLEAAAAGWLAASDGTRLHYFHWPSTVGPARAALLYVHGIAAHAAWFAETARYLAAAGVAVYAPDRRGSGRSSGARGHLPCYEQALGDIRRVVDRIVAAALGAPLFVAGSSWGAKLAVTYTALQRPELAGLVLLSPGLMPRVTLSPPQQLAVLVGHALAPRWRLPIPLTPEMYTRNPVYLADVRDDPLRLLTATARFYWETARLDRGLPGLAPRLRLPLLLLQGADDAMMDVVGARRWFAAVGSPDKTLVVYPGAGHTLDFEPDPAQYRADFARWLLEHAAAVPS
jgi:alpha-beta hydrolase superfamily lysophospholipase